MRAPADDAGLEIRVRRLAAYGVPSSHIARRLGVPRWKVNRILRKQRKNDSTMGGIGNE